VPARGTLSSAIFPGFFLVCDAPSFSSFVYSYMLFRLSRAVKF
jgi:hypothetical protein